MSTRDFTAFACTNAEEAVVIPPEVEIALLIAVSCAATVSINSLAPLTSSVAPLKKLITSLILSITAFASSSFIIVSIADTLLFKVPILVVCELTVDCNVSISPSAVSSLASIPDTVVVNEATDADNVFKADLSALVSTRDFTAFACTNAEEAVVIPPEVETVPVISADA